MSEKLGEFISRHQSLLVLTGAGISTASGIPDYRDDRGDWKHKKPMQYRDFVDQHPARQRYWSRSFVGWQRFGEALPNAAHQGLARLEQMGRIEHIITQNVDGLHQRAGSRRVTELHGSLASVICLNCAASVPREHMQRCLLDSNPVLENLAANSAPDGDALLEQFDSSQVVVPDCDECGGILKPQVVFFGESVPAKRVRSCFDTLQRADAVLVIGSSLMVFSGFRFVREAARLGLPIAAINRGQTRADDLLSLKITRDCVSTLGDTLNLLRPSFAECG